MAGQAWLERIVNGYPLEVVAGQAQALLQDSLLRGGLLDDIVMMAVDIASPDEWQRLQSTLAPHVRRLVRSPMMWIRERVNCSSWNGGILICSEESFNSPDPKR
jgi:hypothetical protein